MYEKVDIGLKDTLKKVENLEYSKEIDKALLGKKKENGLYEGEKNETDIQSLSNFT